MDFNFQNGMLLLVLSLCAFVIYLKWQNSMMKDKIRAFKVLYENMQKKYTDLWEDIHSARQLKFADCSELVGKKYPIIIALETCGNYEVLYYKEHLNSYFNANEYEVEYADIDKFCIFEIAE